MEGIFPGYNITDTKISVLDNLLNWVPKYLGILVYCEDGHRPKFRQMISTATVQSSTSTVWVVTWSVGN